MRRAARFVTAWPIGPALAMITLGACPGPSRPEPPRHAEPAPVSREAEIATEAPRFRDALAALRHLQTIPELWNAQNQAQDHLGQALARLARPTTHRLVTEPRPRITPEGPRPARAVPTQAPRDRWAEREGRPGLCREACRHVAAICYAAGRICGIAGRLGDWAARQACTRAKERCQEARQAVGARCARCPGA